MEYVPPSRTRRKISNVNQNDHTKFKCTHDATAYEPGTRATNPGQLDGNFTVTTSGVINVMSPDVVHTCSYPRFYLCILCVNIFPNGLELVTLGLLDLRSNQLSYESLKCVV